MTYTVYFLYNIFLYLLIFLYNIFIEDMQRKERSFMEDADPEGETNHYLNKIRKPFKGIAC